MWVNRSFGSNQMIDVSESLISLTKNEQMSESLIFWANHSFALFWTKNERFARKSNERIPSPGDSSHILLFTPSRTNMLDDFSPYMYNFGRFFSTYVQFWVGRLFVINEYRLLYSSSIIFVSFYFLSCFRAAKHAPGSGFGGTWS